MNAAQAFKTKPEKRIELIVARIRKDKTQIQAAKEIAVSVNYLRKLELGIESPGRDTMFCIARYYGVSERILFPDLFL
ncbi:helix-turn-helix transcriptional regulator [Lactobacillus crispatus]|uniref:helix-turn-helix domain-containing protein n=1 Tax=Lactobacillus crispatus TaxID=47770 RepID=UPI0029C22B10|nr:helix-turn-helix transcriptional regulator [Lactobacillus crispatus]MDX5091645.1 helix-turn-helix transcriptional regulator [Lactobacillus crispatus]